MSRHGVVAALGEEELVQGFALAGVRVVLAEDGTSVLEAWRELTPDAVVVILTRKAAQALGARVRDSTALTVVLPR
jgi:vacuolar-type H+-ATPase subunit F/Vma7